MGNPLPVDLSQECRKATKILNDFVDPVNGLEKIVPISVLRKAKGFAIFSVFRIGFLMSARAGSGIVIAKMDDGSWTAPAAIGIGGLGGGFNVGAEVTDFLIVLNSRSAVKSFMATGSLQLGGNLSVAVGPLGRSAEASGSVNTSGKIAAMFSYSRSKGLYGGVSVEGTVLVDRQDANSKAYGRPGLTAKQILSGNIDSLPFASGLISTIEKLTMTGSVADRMDMSERRSRNESEGEETAQEFYRRSDMERSWSERQARSGSDDGLPHDDRNSLEPSLGEQYTAYEETSSTRDYSTKKKGERWDKAERHDNLENDNRNLANYAFGSPQSTITNTPPRSGSAGAGKKRLGIRHRSSSVASSLSLGSFGKKKWNFENPTPPPTSHDTLGAAIVDPSLSGTSNGLETSSNARGRLGSTEIRALGSFDGPSLDVQGIPGKKSWSTFDTNDGDINDLTSKLSTQRVSDPFSDLEEGWEERRYSPKPVLEDLLGDGDRSNAPSTHLWDNHQAQNGDQRTIGKIDDVPVIERVIALYDFEAQEEGDLGFSRGQVIAVTSRTNSTQDWWKGSVEVGGRRSKIGR
ncbi:DUF500-domain-containing protein [Violaceomyces palustris]|uniref:DUF500-domain-containing protein n=1 Tax=Violaceomyces palustris TaxID=1673888 RepID=A0ACD0P6W6_9BASI|nr:DUF500-domain-containing protein [Violaceomyces palustris]